MKIPYKPLAITVVLSGVVALWWLSTHPGTKSGARPTNQAAKSVRVPGGDSRNDRLTAAEAEGKPAKPGAAGSTEVSENTIEMRRIVAIPATIGKSGLWAGAAPTDAAIGGKTAYAIARAGSSRADLQPDQNGMFQRMHAAVEQRIEFQVRYPGLKAGQWVDIGILDGGTLETAGRVKPDAEGRVSFVFKTGPSDGSYRISLTTSEHDIKMLDVWAGRPEWEDRLTAQ
jgi:hypothetical protein